jgi:DNA mismatch endonuclease (patch repair protein)
MRKKEKPSRKIDPVPSFVGLLPASEMASRAKRANKKRDTKPELLLRRAIWAVGIRYRKYGAGLPGNPDLVFSSARVVVFCDGDFWHGRNWPALRSQLERRHNPDYWIAKIARNRERDRQQIQTLLADGWLVLRFWETDIIRSPNAVALLVKQAVDGRLHQSGNTAANIAPARCSSSGTFSA